MLLIKRLKKKNPRGYPQGFTILSDCRAALGERPYRIKDYGAGVAASMWAL